jgi:DNA (cytosine-5)-methyltransferase 1
VRIGSLFAGIGGFDLAARWMGWETAWFSEIDPYASAVLAKHWPGVPNHGDITKIDFTQVEPVDMLCGGFPCQDISNAGKRKGIGGERSGLWSEYARAIGELRPRYVVVENVAALLVRGLERVLGDLAALGYDAEWTVLSAADVGAPHLRERLWITAYPNGVEYEGSASAIGRTRAADLLADTQNVGARRRLQLPQGGESARDVADANEVGRRGGAWPQRESRRGESANRRQSVAHPAGERRGEARGLRCDEPTERASRGCEDVADSERRPGEAQYEVRVLGEPHLEGATERHPDGGVSGDWQWAVEPDVGRVADGVPARVDRLRGLGNAIVPQCALEIFRAIEAAEAARRVA